jgi:predicted permease
MVPFGGETWNDGVIPEGTDEEKDFAWENFVSPGYFKAIGTPLLSGRDFDDRDTPTSVKVAIVNQAFARKFFKDQNPLGKRFRLHEPPGKPRPFYEIVGLTGDFKFQDMHEDYLPFAVFPLSQMEKIQPNAQVVVRSTLPLSSLMASLKQAIADVNPAISLQFKPFKTQVHDSLSQDELMATLSGFFGFLAALLAAIGLYGVISYMVVQRTKEIGVRMAIGANRGDVLSLILREAAVLTMIGVVIGTGLALASAQAAKSFLFGLKPRDPLTLVLAIVTLTAVAAFASLLPAYRASRLDPLKALRYD